MMQLVGSVMRVFSAHAEVVPPLTTPTPSRQVFSAHAEVVPPDPIIRFATDSILRARGGSSRGLGVVRVVMSYSPRTRR